MCYIFDSLAANYLLGPGDTVVCLGAGTSTDWAHALPEWLGGGHVVTRDRAVRVDVERDHRVAPRARRSWW